MLYILYIHVYIWEENDYFRPLDTKIFEDLV